MRTETKKKIWNSIAALILLAGISISIFFILRALNVTDAKHLQQIIASTGTWGWVVFLLLQLLITTLLCFIPGTNAMFIAAAIFLFGGWRAFIISSIGVFLSSMLMFFIGNKFGEPVVKKLVGEESLHKAQELIDVKSKIFLPMMFLFPFFPDDALCMVAGITKMKYGYFALITAVFRSIGVAGMCFFGEIVDIKSLTILQWDAILIIGVLFVFAVFKISAWIEQKIKRQKKPFAESEQGGDETQDAPHIEQADGVHDREEGEGRELDQLP